MNPYRRFSGFSRFLHWGMAIMVLTMLFVGVAMVTSLTHYHLLVSLHKPLGIAILLLAVIRLINRLINPPPALPHDMPVWQQAAAKLSHYVLYGLLFALPLIGWAMLSAEGYPIVLWGSRHLPPIMASDPILYADLRKLHTVFAYLLFVTVIAHLGAALMHALIFRDGVFESMASLKAKNKR